ncbi:MAG: SDR family oxidoreductase [Chitinophagaceae bacterium]|nr:SDR family oxidoreductase [Chitinophagaceae bacterium]
MDALFHSVSLTDRKFLVTGGAGFIGSHITAYLLQHGARVRVLDNLATGLPSNVALFRDHPNYEFMEGDIRDFDVCRRATHGIEYVSHQAALGSVPRSVKDPVSSNEVNVSGFVNVLTAAKDSGVRSFVYASSSSVYGDEPNLPKVEQRTGNLLSPYAVTKMANELYANVFGGLYGIRVAGLRYFNVFGPRQDPNGQYAAVIPLFVSGIINRTPVHINGDGEQTRDFTYVDNAVQANVRAMLAEDSNAFGQAYNVATGNNYSVNFLYNSIAEILGIDHAPVYREPRAGDIRDSLADISKAQRLLGYQPTHQFMDGLKVTVDHFKNYYS